MGKAPSDRFPNPRAEDDIPGDYGLWSLVFQREKASRRLWDRLYCFGFPLKKREEFSLCFVFYPYDPIGLGAT